MQKLAAISIAIALMFQCLVQLGIKSWYELNKDYVATVLCENQDKPEMKCNGKCYLKKQMEKTNKKHEKSTGSEEIQIVHFVLPETWQNTTVFIPQDEIHNSGYIADKGITAMTDIFHPPQV